MKTKVALIELFNYHSEVLYSHIKFLKDANTEIIVFVDESSRKAMSDLGLNVDTYFFDFNKFSSLLALRTFIIKNNFDKVIVNTLQGSRALKFSILPFPKRIKFVGVLHNTSKLETSFGQKIISKCINRFFLLAKYVSVPENVSANIEVSYFNPCYFANYENRELSKGDEIWMTIPGGVSLRKKDFDFLIKLAQHPMLKENVRFVLLGNIKRDNGPELYEKLKEKNLLDRFKIFDSFIPNELFHSYIQQSDYLMPLIHPNTPQGEKFTKNKISGTFTLAMGYGIAMLCHKMFENIEGFEYSTLYYESLDQCVGLINSNEKSTVVNRADYEDDRNRYLSFIGLSAKI